MTDMPQVATGAPRRDAARSPAQAVLDAGAALLIGSLGVALADAVVLAMRLDRGIPLRVRAITHLFAAGQLLALGLASALAAAAWRRFGARSRLAGLAALAAVSWAVTYATCAEDVSGLADRLGRKLAHYPMWLALLTLAVSLAVPVTVALGGWLAQPRRRVLGVAAGLAIAVANGVQVDPGQSDLLITQSYPGLHLVAAALAGLLVGRSLRGAALPSPLGRRLSPGVVNALRGAGAMWVAGVLAVWPSNAVAFRLERYPGAALFPFLGPLRRTAAEARPGRVPEAQRAWFTDRAALPAIPPSAPPLLPRDAIVIVIGIDSMRAELLADEKYRPDLPELFRLRDESVRFTHARSAGTSTAPSLASLFAGRYYSELYWARGADGTGLVYPDQDPSPRFPELLAAAGVTTVTFEGAGWLNNRMGVVRGFTVERTIRHKGGYPRAGELLRPLLGRLKLFDDAPRFFFAHLLDAHSPYNSGGRRATPFLGYVAELGQVDKALGRLRETLDDAGLLSRTCLIVMADHGEAFGEHDTRRHASTVYDELLRVPLLIRAPYVAPRVVDDDVSLVDLGPTILDLTGVPTPARYQGQSLTGYLRGEAPALTRPIFAEARLKRAMIMPDGFKVIHDARSHVTQVYDLRRDPGEETNLYQEGDAGSEARLDTLLAFVRAHTLERPGYVVPYRKW